MRKQQKKEAGFIVSAELVLIATILVIGLIVGLVAMRDALTAEMGDVAEAIGSVDQSFTYEGILDPETSAQIAGSQFDDDIDDGSVGVQGDQGQAGDMAPFNYDVPPGATESIF